MLSRINSQRCHHIAATYHLSSTPAQPLLPSCLLRIPYARPAAACLRYAETHIHARVHACLTMEALFAAMRMYMTLCGCEATQADRPHKAHLRPRLLRWRAFSPSPIPSHASSPACLLLPVCVRMRSLKLPATHSPKTPHAQELLGTRGCFAARTQLTRQNGANQQHPAAAAPGTEPCAADTRHARLLLCLAAGCPGVGIPAG